MSAASSGKRGKLNVKNAKFSLPRLNSETARSFHLATIKTGKLRQGQDIASPSGLSIVLPTPATRQDTR